MKTTAQKSTKQRVFTCCMASISLGSRIRVGELNCGSIRLWILFLLRFFQQRSASWYMLLFNPTMQSYKCVQDEDGALTQSMENVITFVVIVMHTCFDASWCNLWIARLTTPSTSEAPFRCSAGPCGILSESKGLWVTWPWEPSSFTGCDDCASWYITWLRCESSGLWDAGTCTTGCTAVLRCCSFSQFHASTSTCSHPRATFYIRKGFALSIRFRKQECEFSSYLSENDPVPKKSTSLLSHTRRWPTKEFGNGLNGNNQCSLAICLSIYNV